MFSSSLLASLQITTRFSHRGLKQTAGMITGVESRTPFQTFAKNTIPLSLVSSDSAGIKKLLADVYTAKINTVK